MNLLNSFSNFGRNFLNTVSVAMSNLWMQLGLDINGEASGDESGCSVSMNSAGDRVAIGAKKNNIFSGHVRIYSWDGIAWTQLGADINAEAGGDLSGWSVSMNSAGDRVAIGAIGNNGGGSSSGHVRVYSWNGIAWTQLGGDINGEAADNSSGYSVSINSAGDKVAIGAPYNSGNGIYSGHVRVYSLSGSAWVKLGADIDGERSNDTSGWSVSMNSAGDKVAIGAPNNDSSRVDCGHVRIYSWDGIAWTQLGGDIDGESGGDLSGWSVSMNSAGDRVAIGAIGNNGGGSSSGHVRIYSWDGIAWTQLGGDINGKGSNEQIGCSVSMNATGDKILIGTYGNRVRIYSWDGIAWTQLGFDINGEAPSDSFGLSVSMNAIGDIVAIGATGNDVNGSNSGHVQVYSIL